MGNKEDLPLMAHLIRRAGFGVNRDELEQLLEKGYESTVEELLHPESRPETDKYTLYRYHPASEISGGGHSPAQLNWFFHLLTNQRHLEEKIALFWHQVFATGNAKIDNSNHLSNQIQKFRDYGLGSYRDLLVHLAKDPAMIFWLDNNENHKRAPNENWGRELLELFSLGVGNYTEKDVLECSRAFTGWTISAKMPRMPYGRFEWHFEFRPEDHDYSEKSFLGHTGPFDGEDIIDIIVKQPACHRFIARHLYNFFVADEPPVPAWSINEPADPDAVNTLAEAFVASNYEIRPVLRLLFNSDFFKEARYKRVKSPVEVVVGTHRLTKDIVGADPLLEAAARQPTYLGQDILNPPSVESWHTGEEWINSGSLVKRINFVADRVGNPQLPGVQDIVKRVARNGDDITPEALVSRCLDQLGLVEVAPETRDELVRNVADSGPVFGSADPELPRRVGETLALIAATREYQFC